MVSPVRLLTAIVVLPSAPYPSRYAACRTSGYATDTNVRTLSRPQSSILIVVVLPHVSVISNTLYGDTYSLATSATSGGMPKSSGVNVMSANVRSVSMTVIHATPLTMTGALVPRTHMSADNTKHAPTPEAICG